MRKGLFVMLCVVTIQAFFLNVHADDICSSLDNVSDTSATKKYYQISISSFTYSPKYSLTAPKEEPKLYFKNYNMFDVRTRKPDYINSVLMRKGNNIQAIPLYTYKLPF